MDSARAKLDDVARLAGVSRTAASRVMNGQSGTSDVVRDRVRTAARQLDFTPHQAARALATRQFAAGRADTIEVLIVDPEPDALSAKPFYGRVMTGALRALGDGDVALRLRLVARPPTTDEALPFGRILINMPAGAAVRLGRTRTISLGRSANDLPFVAPDNAGGARQAARHLIASGRQRIGAVFGPPTPCAGERKNGFLEAVADAGHDVVWVDGDFTRATAYAAAHQLLMRYPDLDAIFAACDVTAMGVLQALREAGRRVRDDVAVVGFDGSTLAEAADLSSVYMPVEDEAESAVRRLLDPSAPAIGRLPTALAIRSSS